MKVLTQAEFDRLAFYLDACAMMRREPFFGKDDAEKCRWNNDRLHVEITLGDRFRFQSALVPFRRIWSSSEPGYWDAILEIVRSIDRPIISGHRIIGVEEQARDEIERVDYPLDVGISRRRVVDLWFNNLVQYEPSEGQVMLKEFDSIRTKFGHAVFESAFRSSVKWIGYHFLRIATYCVEPAFVDAQNRLGLVP
jgi:hypothetical protein